MMASDRVEYIDFAKGFAIVGMIVAHYCVWQKTDFVDHYVHDWFYSFHMPMFIMLSGYFSKPSDVRTTIIKAGKGVLLPFYVFEIIGNILKISLDDNSYSLSYILGIVPGVMLGFQRYEMLALWFLPALFVGKVVLSIIDRYCPRYDVAISLFLFVSVLVMKSLMPDVRGIPLRVDIGMSFVVFLWAGRKVRTSDIFECPLSLNGCVMLALALLAAYQFPVSFPGEFSFPYGIINVVLSVFFSLCVIYICKFISSRFPSMLCSVIVYAGRHSLLILGVHSLSYVIGVQWAFHFCDGTITGFIVAVFTIAICSALLWVYNLISPK